MLQCSIMKTNIHKCIFLLNCWSCVCILGYLFIMWKSGQGQRIFFSKCIPEDHSPQMHTITPTVHPNKTYLARPWNCSNCFQWNYQLLLNQKHICQVHGNRTVELIFLIPSTHTKQTSRDAIRQTWASTSRNNTSAFRHVFFFGIDKDTKRMRKVEEEGRHFRDVVVFNFTDTYRNLTLKTLMMLRWLTEQCPNARFFLKVDDDMWVNPKALLAKVTNVEGCLKSAIAGKCRMFSGVIRNITHKWGVSNSEYPADKYPKYCSGTGYTGTPGVATRIVSVSRDIPFFHLEDVFIGLCLRQLGFSVQNLDGFYAGEEGLAGWDVCSARKPAVATIHRVPPEALYDLWNAKCGED